MNGTNARKAALLANVLANPADDDALLVYADALAEAGDPERGELILLGCRLASSRWYACEHPAEEARWRELVEGHQHRWIASLAKLGVSDVRFHRGLIDTITIPAAAFAKHGAELFEREPIRRVNLVRVEEMRNRDLEMLGQSELVARLDALGLPGTFLNRGRIEALFSEKSFVRNVRALDLSDTVWDRDVLSNIARLVPPFATTDVVLTNMRARGRTDEPIAAELLPLFPRIERVTAKHLYGPVMTRLIGDVVKGQLRGLDLAVDGYVDAMACQRVTVFRALMSLRLRGIGNLNILIHPIGDAQWLSTIETLELGDGGSWPANGSTGGSLVDALHRTKKLEELVLHGVQIDAVLDLLTSHPSFRSLRALTLHNCSVGTAAIERLLQCAELEGLRYLSLRGQRWEMPSADLVSRLRARFGSVSIADVAPG